MKQPDWPELPASLLTPQRTPFPVTAQHQVRPDLYKLEASAIDAAGIDASATDASGLLRADRNAPRYLRAKLDALENTAHPLLLVASGADSAACAAALVAAARVLAAAHPELVAAAGPGDGDIDFVLSGIGLRDDGRGGSRAVAWRDDARIVVERIAVLAQPQRTLAVLALSLQEDLALMANTPRGLVAEALSVAFASGWDPAHKIGRPLFEIHAPVAEGDALRAASDNLARAMVRKGPFLRYVWTIADSDALARPPAQRVVAARPDALWFRCERQVTLPLAALDRSLFLIRVFVAPLAEVAGDAVRRALLASALASMSDEVVRYKGLESVREVLTAAWGRTR